MSVLVTFDLDNTLWDVDPVLVRAESALHHWFEDHYPGFNSMYDSQQLAVIRQELSQSTKFLQANLSQLRMEVYKQAFLGFGLSDNEANEAAQSAFVFFNEWRQKVDLYPNAFDVLSRLANSYRLGVITNGTADVFHQSINIGEVFEFALRADQQGVAKPAKKIFEQAAEMAKVELKNVVHVGDHPDDDVYGIKNAGGKSVWFNRHGAMRWLDAWGRGPDAEIHSLEELPDVLPVLLK